jgi:hypothetical protein
MLMQLTPLRPLPIPSSSTLVSFYGLGQAIIAFSYLIQSRAFTGQKGALTMKAALIRSFHKRDDMASEI